MIRVVKNTGIVLGISLSLLLAFFSYAQAKAKSYTICIAMDDSSFAEELNGFSSGMAEKGYIKDKNIKYISFGFVENDKKIIDSETKKILYNDVDVIVAIGNYSALWADKAAKGTDIAVIFSMISSDPVGEGIVKSLSQPGGNVTGIRVPDSIPKSLEWLKTISPGIKKVYLPYNPADEISVLALIGLNETASQLGIELVLHKIRSVEEVLAAIENMPEDIDAIFRIPSQTLDPRNSELSQAAIKRELPMGSALQLDEAVLATFSPDLFQAGKQTARLVHQIIQGAKPADLPIETSDVFLTINLKTAEKIGINVPADVLAQAKTIIR